MQQAHAQQRLDQAGARGRDKGKGRKRGIGSLTPDSSLTYHIIGKLSMAHE